MAISYVGGNATGAAGSTSTTVVDLTTALTGGSGGAPIAGDLVVVTVSVGTQGARKPTISIGTPSGYTALTVKRANGAYNYYTNVQTCYKVMGGTPDTSVTIPASGNIADGIAYAVQVFRGVDPTTPMDVTATYATGSGVSNLPNGATITPVTVGACIVVCGGGASQSSAGYSASGLSAFISANGSDTCSGTVGAGVYPNWVSGAYDPAAWTNGSTNVVCSWGCTTIALRPLPPHALTPTYVGGTTSLAGAVAGNRSVSLTGLTGGISSSPQAGDIVVVAVSTNYNSDIAVGVVSPSGYTEIADLFVTGINFSVSYKLMGDTPDTSVTVTGTPATNNGSAAAIHVWRGVNPITPMDVTATTATGGNTGIADGPSISPSTPGAIVLSAFGSTSNTATTASPEFYTNPCFDYDSKSGDSAVGIASVAWSSGAQNPTVWPGLSGSTSYRWAAVTLALAPRVGDVSATASGTATANDGLAASSTSDAQTDDAATAGSTQLGDPNYATDAAESTSASDDNVAAQGNTSAVKANGETLTYVGGTTGFGASSDHAVSLTSLTGGIGSAPEDGDLIIATVGVATSGADVNCGVSTAGYVELLELYQVDSVCANLSVSYKFAEAAADTSLTVQGSGLATSSVGTAIQVWRYVDRSTPFDVDVLTATGSNSAAVDSPTVSPVSKGAVVITAGMAATAAPDASITAPTGFINLVQVSYDAGSAATTVMASKDWAGGGENPPAWNSIETFTTASWAAATLVLRPANIVNPTAEQVVGFDVANTQAATANTTQTKTMQAAGYIAADGTMEDTPTGKTTQVTAVTEANSADTDPIVVFGTTAGRSEPSSADALASVSAELVVGMPIFVGSTFGANTTTSGYNIQLAGALTGGIASSPSAGDVVLVIGGTSQAYLNNQGFNVTHPNYVHVYVGGQTQASSNLNAGFGFFAYKVMPTTPDSLITIGGNSGTGLTSGVLVLVWRNIKPEQIQDAVAVTELYNNVANGPPITPTVPGTIVVSANAHATTTLTIPTTPTGYTALRNFTVNATPRLVMTSASKLWSGSGDEDPGAWGTQDSGSTAACISLTFQLVPLGHREVMTSNATQAAAATLLSTTVQELTLTEDTSTLFEINSSATESSTATEEHSNLVEFLSDSTEALALLEASSVGFGTSVDQYEFMAPISVAAGGSELLSALTEAVAALEAAIGANTTSASKEENASLVEAAYSVFSAVSQGQETASATEVYTALAAFLSAAAEAATAGHADAAVAAWLSAQSESATAIDTWTAAANLLSQLSESGALSDQATTVFTALADIIGSVSAADAASSLKALVASGAESATLADASLAANATTSATTEPASTDTAQTAAAAFLAALSGIVTALAAHTATGALNAAAAEAQTPTHTQAGALSVTDTILEALAAGDSCAATAAFVASLTNAVSATESSVVGLFAALIEAGVLAVSEDSILIPGLVYAEESASATDAATRVLGVLGDAAETGSAQSATTAVATFISALTGLASATDGVTSIGALLASRLEPAVAAEASAAIAGYLATVSATLAAGADQTPLLTIVSAATEANSAVTVQATSAAFLSDSTAPVSAVNAQTSAVSTPTVVAEAAEVTGTQSASAAFAAASPADAASLELAGATTAGQAVSLEVSNSDSAGSALLDATSSAVEIATGEGNASAAADVLSVSVDAADAQTSITATSDLQSQQSELAQALEAFATQLYWTASATELATAIDDLIALILKRSAYFTTVPTQDVLAQVLYLLHTAVVSVQTNSIKVPTMTKTASVPVTPNTVRVPREKPSTPVPLSTTGATV